jgi:hypothetical protein
MIQNTVKIQMHSSSNWIAWVYQSECAEDVEKVALWGVHKTGYISAASAAIGTTTLSYKCYGGKVLTRDRPEFDADHPPMGACNIFARHCVFRCQALTIRDKFNAKDLEERESESQSRGASAPVSLVKVRTLKTSLDASAVCFLRIDAKIRACEAAASGGAG